MAKFVKFALLILLLQVLMSFAVLADIPMLRETLGLLCLILPGLATLPLIKVKVKTRIELLLYSAGLSLVVLMVVGLVINTLYPLIPAPLSTVPVIFALDMYVACAILASIALRRESPLSSVGQDAVAAPVSSGKLRKVLYGALIVVFPALAVYGTWSMNAYGSNTFLMVMIALMALAFLVVLLDKKAPESAYSLFILSTSVSLLFLYSLRSFYLLGFDIHGEYYTFELALQNFHWSLGDYQHIYNTCLSITILPVMLCSILGIDGETIFKVVMQLAFALMPLAAYMFFKEKVGKRMALLAAFFMMSHYMFIYQMPSLARQEVSILLFVLAVMVLYSERIRQPGGVALFLLFGLGTVLSHYTTSFLFLFIIAFTWFMGQYMRLTGMAIDRKVAGKLVLAVLLMILIWHGLISRITLSAAIVFGINTLVSFNNLLLGVDSDQSPIASAVLGSGLETMLPKVISFAVGTLSRILVVLGVVYVARRYLTARKTDPGILPISMDQEYVITSIGLMVLVAVSLFVPFVSVGYNLERLYMQSLIFLAPMCALGLLFFLKNIRLETTLICIGLLVAVFFICQTGFLHQVFDIRESISLNPDTEGGYLVYPQEVQSARWLAANESPVKIYADNYGTLRLWSYAGIPRGYGYDTGAYVLDSNAYSYRNTRYDLITSYMYLDHFNVENDLIFDGWGTKKTTLNNFTYLDRMDSIYDNGGSIILKASGRGL